VSGKGSSDASMIIDAMDILFTNEDVSGFALVSSDSDFTRLAQRLREAGKNVIGFGRKQTPEPFVIACERFIYTENSINESNNPEEEILVTGSTNDNRPSSKIYIICQGVLDYAEKYTTFVYDSL